jgi:hypothetical protein
MQPLGYTPASLIRSTATYDDPTLLDPRRGPLDDELRRLAARFRARPGGVRNSLTEEELYVLLNFARRAAVFAMRERDAAWIADGLTAVAMVDDERIDPAELPPALGLLHHAATFIGADAAALFAAAAKQATRSVSRFFRTPAFEGWEETAGGFVRREPNDYRPAHDLLRVAINVRAALGRDHYVVDDVVLGAALPEEFFVEPPRAKGVVMLRARDRERGHRIAFAFVAEMEGHALCAPTDVPSIAADAGNLLCLLIAPFEKPAALQRFAEPMRHALAASPATPAR